MAGKNDPVSAQTRQKVADAFQSAINAEPNAQRKAALGAAIGPAISAMVGMTGEEASAHLIQTILSLKSI